MLVTGSVDIPLAIRNYLSIIRTAIFIRRTSVSSYRSWGYRRGCRTSTQITDYMIIMSMMFENRLVGKFFIFSGERHKLNGPAFIAV